MPGPVSNLPQAYRITSAFLAALAARRTKGEELVRVLTAHKAERVLVLGFNGPRYRFEFPGVLCTAHDFFDRGIDTEWALLVVDKPFDLSTLEPECDVPVII